MVAASASDEVRHGGCIGDEACARLLPLALALPLPLALPPTFSSISSSFCPRSSSSSMFSAIMPLTSSTCSGLGLGFGFGFGSG